VVLVVVEAVMAVLVQQVILQAHLHHKEIMEDQVMVLEYPVVVAVVLVQ
jgi:hypothetical protein